MMNELAGHNLGGYLLEEEIGRGSMGVVYRGKQIALGREVAIKLLPQSLAKDPSYIARFIREARIIAELNHPNIVHIYDAGQLHNLLYFVMEFVQGPTIASLLSLDGSIPQHLAAEYAAQIAEALDAAYSERNVIHRDIKPENLMLNRWGKIKVMDFGLARAPGHQVITEAKTLVGSIYYSSPEQLWGHILDNRSDVYALGVVLYEMICGHRPFHGRTMAEVSNNITRGRFQPPSYYVPSLSPQLEQIILTALSRDREKRYNEAGLMALELRQLQFSPSNSTLPAIPTANRSEGSLHDSSPSVYSQQRSMPSPVRPPRRPTQRPDYLYDESERDAVAKPEEAHQQAQQQPSKELHLPLSPSLLPTLPLPAENRHQLQNASSLPEHTAQNSQDSSAQSQNDDRPRLWQHLHRFFSS